MLLARIQRDLFDFTSQEGPDDFGPLLNFWYRANTPALSAALTAHPGLKLIIDAPSVRALEHMSKKLFLLADTVVLRGLSPEPPRHPVLLEPGYLTPTSHYKPGYIEEVISQLEKLQPSPLTLMGPDPYWTSTSKTLKNGLHAAYAMDMHGGTPREIVQWISGPGRKLLESGRLAYAPFIPSLEMEHEFIRNKVDLSAYFNTSPCFHHSVDWLTKQQLDVLFSLQFPCLDGLDLETLAQVKNDYHDEFESFSRLMLNSLDIVKATVDTEQFASEVRNVQRNLIDAGVSDVERTFKRISALSSLRRKGMVVGLLGLNAAAYFGAPELFLVSGLAASGVKMVVDKIDELKEQSQLKEFRHYFLWKVSHEVKRAS
ncbi:hypothetical protein [Pollutimonas bauzanensis]|uniref:Uncharacterized protein n=1 Tax=Pollutimonas bauzanensis TaxID=658167 RepID=A0A1M5UHY6_9BURK|nr:hypothetical protein [Pollutimonas bauzanensis]SHH62518.1 hypothetical protein SAMN04488135_1043 [Pollutimonas bauzanensis]